MTKHVMVLIGALALVRLSLGAQAPPVGTQQTLSVTGDVVKALALTPADLKAMPRSPMNATDERGRTAAYDGVLLSEVLRRAGVSNGESLKGKALSTYVLISARDAYQVVFSLAEIDPAVTDSSILLADTMDGHPIPEAQGPLRIIVPHDKQGSRWVRQVEKIEVVHARK